jgi:hypothetical protein
VCVCRIIPAVLFIVVRVVNTLCDVQTADTSRSGSGGPGYLIGRGEQEFILGVNDEVKYSVGLNQYQTEAPLQLYYPAASPHDKPRYKHVTGSVVTVVMNVIKRAESELRAALPESCHLSD